MRFRQLGNISVRAKISRIPTLVNSRQHALAKSVNPERFLDKRYQRGYPALVVDAWPERLEYLALELVALVQELEKVVDCFVAGKKEEFG
jgi:hypothetical protein